MLGLKGVHRIMPPMPGLCPKSGLTLLGVYVIGRLYRVYEWRFDQISIVWYIISAVFLGVVCTFGMGWFGTYNSPFAVAFGLVGFHVIKKIRFPRWMCLTSIWLSPTIFSVYLFHANEFGYMHVNGILGMLTSQSVPLAMAFVMVIVWVFLLSVVLDLPRRFLMSIMNRVK